MARQISIEDLWHRVTYHLGYRRYLHHYQTRDGYGWYDIVDFEEWSQDLDEKAVNAINKFLEDEHDKSDIAS